jgi:hypothetical protein
VPSIHNTYCRSEYLYCDRSSTYLKTTGSLILSFLGKCVNRFSCRISTLGVTDICYVFLTLRYLRLQLLHTQASSISSPSKKYFKLSHTLYTFYMKPFLFVHKGIRTPLVMIDPGTLLDWCESPCILCT